ncbi:TrmH family RNA methyltransferase [Salsipaludibacter albus]|uniref:TrmH family RNA methyltransferase n=1 Tax=Salsipaludibacter albus TaxID=2849650 RepID=UPI001EE4A584|nr:RNA methyltransferase [Salsipaludibacter albus]MBY5163787.1 RNA methyltransferase [Salsipaludibacter albus]
MGRPEPITSVRNDRVVAAAGLSAKKRRDASGTYLVEGQHPVAEVLADGLAETVFVTADRRDEVVALPGADRVEVVEVADHVLERIADARSPQGMVAVARQRWSTPAEAVAGTAVTVLLVDANDPGNVGAIVRTADAAGARAVVLTTGSCDPHNPKAVRAAAGSVSHLQLAMADDPVAVVDAARAAGRRTLALDGSGDLDLLAAGPHPGGDLLVMGSEAHGLPADVLSAVDGIAYVPIRGRAESLNLAAATAVALYAVTSPPGDS